MESLTPFYVLPQDQHDQINDFLADHTHLLPILDDARDHIQSIFGKHLVRVTIDFGYDQESMWEYLAVTIFTDILNRKDIMKLMDELDDTWWLDVEEDLLVLSANMPEDEELAPLKLHSQPKKQTKTHTSSAKKTTRKKT